MQTHVKVIGLLHIFLGAMGVFAGLGFMLLFGGIAGLAAMSGNGADAAVALPVLGGIGGIIFVVALILSVPSIIAGIGLLNFRPWARILTLVLSVLHLVNLPFGTVLGFYGLWALLSREGAALFQRTAAVRTT